MIPEEVQHYIQRSLDQKIISVQRVSGGSINQTARVTLADGSLCFLKWNQTARPDMFVKEQRGLELLASADTSLRIPKVLATGTAGSETETGFLLQEYIEEGRAVRDSDEKFGLALAALHKHTADQYGLDHDNYIGRLPQSNKRHSNWVYFFIEERMKPQVKLATDSGKLGSKAVSSFESMYKQLPDIFPHEPPSLLHGDLWSGNYFYDEKGRATIYDPAVYYGNREIELSFTYLFGGYSSGFYKAYREAYPLDTGFKSRKDIYNLYPLLVHTNLFGGSYARQVESIVNQF